MKRDAWYFKIFVAVVLQYRIRILVSSSIYIYIYLSGNQNQVISVFPNLYCLKGIAKTVNCSKTCKVRNIIP